MDIMRCNIVEKKAQTIFAMKNANKPIQNS